MSKNMKIAILAGVAMLMVCIVGIGSLFGGRQTSLSDLDSDMQEGSSLDELMKRVDYSTATPVKASIDLGSGSSLYDELPEIDKYPLTVEGHGDVDIEIFTSGEKAGEGNDSWLIDEAQEFNNSGVVTSDGSSVSISVRSVASGLAADYIISGKYMPDLYTPSNVIFGEYAIANGGKLEMYNERLVGNTAGFLVRKDSQYNSVEAVLDVVISGELNVGYTNPQSSASGANLLIELLKDFGSEDVKDAKAVDAFSKFSNNIPFVAYTTQQMIESAQGGSLDGMISEYQAYINNAAIRDSYKFIPFGLRHDNPLYIVDKSKKSGVELEAVGLVNDFLCSADAQDRATRYGFNANDDYVSSYETNGIEIIDALNVYKQNKDSGRDIIAVFVADCSGSMEGAPLNELKRSLSNSMQYINENNYVGLVSYSSDITIEVPVAKFDLTQKSYFQGALNNLQASGSTYSYEAICLGMKMIKDAQVDHPDAKCMLFLLSDGCANGYYTLNDVAYAVKSELIPVYTIGYTSGADAKELQAVSGINEAASISADTDDIVYRMKSLFNAQL